MKPGAGKRKGGAFERSICESLSHWVTGGRRRDLFWRSAMSGGRATVAHRKTGKAHAAAGDICSVSAEGHNLTDRFFIDCKYYKSLHLDQLCYHGKGLLSKFWQTAVEQASNHSLEPMLIARQNRYPTLIVVKPGVLEQVVDVALLQNKVLVHHPDLECEIRLLEDVLALPYRR